MRKQQKKGDILKRNIYMIKKIKKKKKKTSVILSARSKVLQTNIRSKEVFVSHFCGMNLKNLKPSCLIRERDFHMNLIWR